jgi:hypothetical protein
MTSTIHHTLKNFVRGWTNFHINPIDIRKIVKISYHKRLFCIFQREYKYTLEIEYYNPRSESDASPIITTGGQVGFAFTNEYFETSQMTIRYKSENEIKQEIDEIKKIQDIIKIFDEEQNKKLAEFILQHKTK